MPTLTAAINQFDLQITRGIQSWPAWLNPAMVTLSFIGQPAAMTTLGVLVLLYAALRHYSNVAIAFAAALVSLTFSAGLKHVWQRTRPDTAHALGLHTYSFPSGHTYGSTVMFGLLAYLAWHHLPGVWHVVVPGLLVALIIVIGLSRVYVGAHYPTDVVGGWVLGLIIVTVITRVSHI